MDFERDSRGLWRLVRSIGGGPPAPGRGFVLEDGDGVLMGGQAAGLFARAYGADGDVTIDRGHGREI